MSSNRGDWRTPLDLMAKIQSEFGPLFDVSDRHGGTFDALTDPWPDRWYCNPPYGREIGVWVARMDNQIGAFEIMERVGVALLPARTDTAWFQDYIYGRAELRFLRGRLHFDDTKGAAPFPSMLAIFRPHPPALNTQPP